MNPFEKRENFRKILKVYGGSFLTATLVALAMKGFFFEIYRLPSGSMAPNFQAGDTLLASKLAYGFRFPGSTTPHFRKSKPSYGDVVVYANPVEGGKEFIKRITGLPGDRVELKNGEIYINGKIITHLPPNKKVKGEEGRSSTRCGTESPKPGVQYAVCAEDPYPENFGPETLGPDHYFVVGDYRAKSVDQRGGRNWASVPEYHIRARAKSIWISIEPLPSSGNGPSWFTRLRRDRFLKPVL